MSLPLPIGRTLTRSLSASKEETQSSTWVSATWKPGRISSKDGMDEFERLRHLDSLSQLGSFDEAKSNSGPSHRTIPILEPTEVRTTRNTRNVAAGIDKKPSPSSKLEEKKQKYYVAKLHRLYDRLATQAAVERTRNMFRQGCACTGTTKRRPNTGKTSFLEELFGCCSMQMCFEKVVIDDDENDPKIEVNLYAGEDFDTIFSERSRSGGTDPTDDNSFTSSLSDRSENL